MKFVIQRTSQYIHGGPPCKEAFKAPIVRIDQRTFKTFEEHDRTRARSWESDGTNHRKRRGGIARDFLDTAWWIEVNSLDDLMALYRKYGSLVIEGSWENDEFPMIELYDKYRE